jgi:hypothetical protein
MHRGDRLALTRHLSVRNLHATQIPGRASNSLAEQATARAASGMHPCIVKCQFSANDCRGYFPDSGNQLSVPTGVTTVCYYGINDALT